MAFAAIALALESSKVRLMTRYTIGRTTAPKGCSTVSSAGGNYSSVQDAVNAAFSGGCIFLDKGIYNEQVYVETDSLTIYGYTTNTASYSDNGATITASKSQVDGLSNDGAATLRVHGANFKLYNVNVKNTFGRGSQAVALSVKYDSGYYGCQFAGYQDTVYASAGNQLYSKCYIEGVTDFIFGQDAPAWFESCDIGVLSASLGFITANGRYSNTSSSYYVFNNCSVNAASGESVSPGAFYLGRPWREFARVAFQNSELSDVINSAGWSEWSPSQPNTNNVTFAEYNNIGTGAFGARPNFVEALHEALLISEILGGDYTSAGYYDANYM